MWEDAAFSGYRKMVVFDGYLYVFAGLTNFHPLMSPQFNYSIVYRFAPDFEFGDEPEVVLLAPLPANAIEYYRAAFVDKDAGIFYVGTFDGKIFYTDSSAGLTAYTGSGFSGVNWSAGWDCVDLKADRVLTDCVIWDIAFFKGSLYAFIAGTTAEDTWTASVQGFSIYKLTESAGTWTIEQIVGEDEAPYASGLGIGKHTMASPWIFESFDDYMYVSTFANGPLFLGSFGAGILSPFIPYFSIEAELNAFNRLYCPASIYRFDGTDWEVVVGDTMNLPWADVAKDKSGAVVPRIGGSDGMRAGFFPGVEPIPNISSNQYIWWMAEYDGKIWASTWDIGVFRPVLNENPELVLAVAASMIGSNDDLAAIVNQFMAIYGGASTALDAADYQAVMSDLASTVMTGVNDIMTAAGNFAEIQAILLQLANDVTRILAPVAGGLTDPLADLRDAIIGLYNVAIATDPTSWGEIIGILRATAMFVLYTYDASNPGGFDLFYSEDGGATWVPYTVNGLGDATNYGGRVLLPTEYGFFILTANPFTGCQVWKVGGEEEPAGIDADLPDSFVMKKGESVTFLMQSFGMDPDSIAVTVGDGTVVSATVKVIQVDPTAYTSTVTKTLNLQSYGGYGWVEEGGYGYVYEVTLTALKEFEGTVDVTITGPGGLEFDRDVGLKITGDDDGNEDSNWILWAIAALILIYVLVLAAVALRKR
jgi:hypothetical protein